MRFTYNILIVLFLLLAGCANDPARIPPFTPEPHTDSLKVHFIDVGQGDASLIEYSGYFVLIDGGDTSAAAKLVTYLTEQEVDTLDLVIVSHAHLDHYGGLLPVLRTFPVKTVGQGRVGSVHPLYYKFLSLLRDSLPVIDEVFLEKGDSFGFGELQVDIVYPADTLVHSSDSANEYSVVCQATYGQCVVLYTGDITRETELILAGLPGTSLASDILKVPHHGSNTSSSLQFLQAVAPVTGVISCGLGNTYQHPHQDVLDRLTGLGITVYRTDMQGDLVFSVDTTGQIYGPQ